MLNRLDAINDMIVSTGAVALNAEQNRHPLYQTAERKLQRVRAAVLAMALYFNTEVRTIKQTASGELYVPDRCVRADPTDRLYNLTLRGRRMYDLNTGTYEINRDVRLKMAFDMDFEEIPLIAQEFIAAKSVYEFYLDQDGADPKLTHYRSAQNQAWTILWREHLRSVQANIHQPNNAITAIKQGSHRLRGRAF